MTEARGTARQPVPSACAPRAFPACPPSITFVTPSGQLTPLFALTLRLPRQLIRRSLRQIAFFFLSKSCCSKTVVIVPGSNQLFHAFSCPVCDRFVASSIDPAFIGSSLFWSSLRSLIIIIIIILVFSTSFSRSSIVFCRFMLQTLDQYLHLFFFFYLTLFQFPTFVWPSNKRFLSLFSSSATLIALDRCHSFKSLFWHLNLHFKCHFHFEITYWSSFSFENSHFSFSFWIISTIFNSSILFFFTHLFFSFITK